jgi:transposase
MSQNLNGAVAVIGIDIGKNSFHVVGLDDRGAIVLRQKWSRGQIEARLANMPPCLIGMEACVGAHHLSRKLKALGHDARLMPAKYVRPYSKGQKNDFRDAEAIAEAVQRPTMKFVASKTADQLDLQALHRVRERLVSQRTGIINQIRAFLLERGVAVRQGLRFLRAELPRILASPPDVLSARMVQVISDLAEDWRRLDERIDRLSSEIAVLARQDAGCERLMSVPGIGPIISSAMVAAIGTGDAFTKGRDFAAWLGLVPKQISTGDRISSARYRSAVTATCAFYSCKQRGSCSSSQ